MLTIRTLVCSVLVVTWSAVMDEQTAAQTDEPETVFQNSEIVAAPCPPSFPAIYPSPSGLRFFGKSRLTMSQYDETHTYQLFTYEYRGETADEQWTVTGIHHVNAAQCTSAAWSYWSGMPALIARLHHEQRTPKRASGGGGSGGCGYDYASDYEVYDPYGPEDTCAGYGGPGGGGGGEGDEQDMDNLPEDDTSWLCEDLGLVSGCYDVYIDGMYDSTICC